MERLFESKITEWLTGGATAPLLFTGFRGVGKTATVLNYLRSRGIHYRYVDFETDGLAVKALQNVESGNFTQIMSELLEIDEEYLRDFILVFDEISFAKRLMTVINELQDANLRIIAISSFPVDSSVPFNRIKVYPLNFEEFLLAAGKEWYRDIIEGQYHKQKPLPQMIHDELLEMFYEYLRVGGMPEAVNAYIRSDSYDEIGGIQLRLYKAIINDIEVIGETSGVAAQGKAILRSLPYQLAEKEKHFRFNRIRKGATFQMYSDAIDMLVSLGLVIKYDRQESDSGFILTISDNGILSMLLKSIGCETENTDILLKAYFASLLNTNNIDFEFWESDYSAVVDFVFKINASNYAGFVCSGTAGKSRALTNYRNRIMSLNSDGLVSFYISESQIETKNDQIHMPLYYAHLFVRQ